MKTPISTGFPRFSQPRWMIPRGYPAPCRGGTEAAELSPSASPPPRSPGCSAAAGRWLHGLPGQGQAPASMDIPSTGNMSWKTSCTWYKWWKSHQNLTIYNVSYYQVINWCRISQPSTLKMMRQNTICWVPTGQRGSKGTAAEQNSRFSLDDFGTAQVPYRIWRECQNATHFQAKSNSNYKYQYTFLCILICIYIYISGWRPFKIPWALVEVSITVSLSLSPMPSSRVS